MLTGITSDDLAQLQKDIRAVERDFANASQREIRAAVAPFTATLKDSAKVNVPSWIASDVASTVRQSVGFKGVAVKTGPNSRFTQSMELDQGIVRHPLFGDRGFWYDTWVPGARGWFSRVGEDNVPETEERLRAAINLIMDRIAYGNFSVTKTFRTVQSGKNAGKTTYTPSL